MAKSYENLIRNVAVMNRDQIREQYNEAVASAPDFENDPVGLDHLGRLIDVIAAIANLKFPDGWRKDTSNAIHHIDGNPYNNSPENLRVVSVKERA